MQGQLVNGPTSVGLREFSLAREGEPPSGYGRLAPGGRASAGLRGVWPGRQSLRGHERVGL